MTKIAKWLPIALLVIAPSIAITSFYYGLQRSKDAVKRSVCTGHLKSLAIALHHYKADQNRLPPPFLLGPDGKRWHSWRVLILPYMGDDGIDREYRFDEPWDGPNNSKIATKMPKIYGCPGDPEGAARGETNYFAIVGPETAFPDDGQTSPFPWTDRIRLPNSMAGDPKPLLSKNGQPLLRSPGKNRWSDPIPRPSETILLAESSGRGINWLDPRDLDLNEISFILNDPNAPSMSSNHRGSSVFAAMVDSSVRPVTGLDPEKLRRMCQVDPDKLSE